jgi:hypothetical protein
VRCCAGDASKQDANGDQQMFALHVACWWRLLTDILQKKWISDVFCPASPLLIVTASVQIAAVQ